MSSNLEQRMVDAVRRLSLARPRDLTRLGLRREYVQRLTERGALVRVARGLYAVPDAEISTHRSLVEVAVEALKDYLKKYRRGADALCRFAKICRVANVMRPYLEAAG